MNMVERLNNAINTVIQVLNYMKSYAWSVRRELDWNNRKRAVDTALYLQSTIERINIHDTEELIFISRNEYAGGFYVPLKDIEAALQSHFVEFKVEIEITPVGMVANYPYSDTEQFKDELEKVFTCPICGKPKTHHRLYGYICDNPEHNQDIEFKQLKQWRDKNGR